MGGKNNRWIPFADNGGGHYCCIDMAPTAVGIKGQIISNYLMARNLAPEVACQECDQPTTWLCIECVYEDDQPGWLCDEHVEGHPHDSCGDPLPAVNSPRQGMCGYYGPAEPPY